MTPSLERRRAAWRLLALALLALVPLLGRPAAGAQDDAGGGVETVTGTVTITNPLVGRVYSQPFMNLTDLTAFVERDLLMPLPSPVQITANLEGDLRRGATFRLPLPIRPEGETNDVAHGQGGEGVQIYAVDFQANAFGDPFLGPLEMKGWPSALTSIEVAIGTDEVTGGQVAVWAADDGEAFPTGFGPDGLLFTDDDPVGPIPSGWTIVDLNAEPFARLRDREIDVPIIEGEIGLKDYSDLSYTAAFDRLLDDLRRRYPFTAYKRLDWDAIAAELRPAVAEAERAGDKAAFNVVLLRLALLMNDGHAAADPPDRYILDRFGGGVGLAIGKTDDGAIVVRCVVPDSPAAEAGIEPGAAVVEWGGAPAAEAVAATEPLFAESTALGRELQRLQLLPRMPVDEEVAVAFRNPGAAEETTATLRAERDAKSLLAPCGLELADPAEPPISVEVLPSGIGYVKVNTFADDMVLIAQTWEWALRQFRQLDVPALIVDVRTNGGGVSLLPIFFAGSFYAEPFTLAEQIFIDEEGNEVVTAIDRVEPAPVQWRRPVAVLIGSDCVSACELFAAAMAHDPEHLLVGRTNTAGVEGGVFPWLLPGDLSFRAPLIAFREPDGGGVFVEGVGVPPTLRVPTTADSLLLPEPEDTVLKAAEAALLERVGNRQGERAKERGKKDRPAPGATPVPPLS